MARPRHRVRGINALGFGCGLNFDDGSVFAAFGDFADDRNMVEFCERTLDRAFRKAEQEPARRLWVEQELELRVARRLRANDDTLFGFLVLGMKRYCETLVPRVRRRPAAPETSMHREQHSHRSRVTSRRDGLRVRIR